MEANVEQAYGNVEQGTQQLMKATHYQVGNEFLVMFLCRLSGRKMGFL